MLLSFAVLIGAIGATGLAFDGLIGALLAEAEFLTPLALFGSAYAFEFLILVWGELWAFGLGGFLGLGSGIRLFVVGVGVFGLSGSGVAGVGRHGEYEDVLEGTAYWPRVRGELSLFRRRLRQT